MENKFGEILIKIREKLMVDLELGIESWAHEIAHEKMTERRVDWKSFIQMNIKKATLDSNDVTDDNDASNAI